MRRDRVRPAAFPVAEGATTTYTVRIDKSYPTLAPAVTPDPVLLHGRVAVAPHATDAVSGIASSACGRVSSATVGRHTVTCTATDSVGNATSADVDYTVLYRARVLAPTVAPLLVNSVKPRHDTLLRFRLTDAARVPVSSTAAVTAVTAKATSCTRFDTDPTGGTSVLKPQPALQQQGRRLRANLACAHLRGTTLTVALDSGQRLQAFFQVTR